MKRSNIIGLIGAVLGIAVIFSIISWLYIGSTPTILQGRADATSYKASSKIAGRIDSLFVKEGQRVAKGDLLYILSTPEIEAKLRQAKGALAAASAQEKKALAGARVQEIEAVRDMWIKAEAALALAVKNYDRSVNLYSEGVIPAQRMDEAEANYKALSATSSAAKSQYMMALEGARSEDISSAMALSQQAAGAVAEVESYMDDAKIYSPVEGEISTVIAEQGELVGSGYPVVTIVDMSDIWVSYNIKEDLMPKIEIGKRFTAYMPALGHDVEFVIDFISVQADFATWSATKMQGGFDIRTFSVKTRPVSEASKLRPGMSAIMDWDKL